MDTRRMRSARVICATLGCCLGLAAAAAGQSGMGGNQRTLTPQQQAWQDQVVQLDNAAWLALDAGRYDEAVSDARQADAKNPIDPISPHILAVALEDLGNVPEAFEAYKVLADRGSCQPGDLMPYALMLLQKGQWGKALAAYEKALPFVAEGDLLRANSAFSPSLPQPAALEAAIHIARGLTFNSGTKLVRHSEDDRALAEYQKALVMEPSSDLANYYYGFGLQRVGQVTQAQAVFTKTINMARGDVKVAAEQALKKMKKPV